MVLVLKAKPFATTSTVTSCAGGAVVVIVGNTVDVVVDVVITVVGTVVGGVVVVWVEVGVGIAGPEGALHPAIMIPAITTTTKASMEFVVIRCIIPILIL